MQQITSINSRRFATSWAAAKLMKRIVFATNNQHKLQEIRDILGSGYEVVSLKEIGCDVDIPETGNTLEENALQEGDSMFMTITT